MSLSANHPDLFCRPALAPFVKLQVYFLQVQQSTPPLPPPQIYLSRVRLPVNTLLLSIYPLFPNAYSRPIENLQQLFAVLCTDLNIFTVFSIFLGLAATVARSALLYRGHRLDIEVDLQSLFGLHHSCTPWLRPRNSPPPA